jgi:flagellar biogenesis protein FliO
MIRRGGVLGFRAGAVAATLLTGAPALAQRLGQGTGTEVPVWRVLGALAFCLLLAGAAAVLLKRRLRGPGRVAFGRARRLQLVESLRLSHQIDLCVVSCDGTEFMLAASPHGATLINADLPRPTASEQVE